MPRTCNLLIILCSANSFREPDLHRNLAVIFHLGKAVYIVK